MAHHSQLYFMFGLWVSFVGFFMAGISLLPTQPVDAKHLSAMVYQSASHEELHEASTITRVGKVISVDEGSKKISLYENGQELRSFSITSLASPGSIHEAPSGRYTVEKKEYKHFSPMLGAWMPYSVEISGNVFIHGAPEDSRGSGEGSIGLATPDAKEVFEFCGVGTQVVVTGAVSRDLLP